MEPTRIESHNCRTHDGRCPNVLIGNYCSIGKNCSFILANHIMDRVISAPCHHKHLLSHGQGNMSGYAKGDIVIGHDVRIGGNCTIMDGINIGNGAVICAGSVVTKDIPAYAIVCGNPARIMSYRFSEDIIQRLETLKFWELPESVIAEYDLKTKDLGEFIRKVEATR